MKIIKGTLNIATWIIAIFFQFVFGIITAIVVFSDSYANVIAMWAAMTFVVFVVGAANILFRKSIAPKKYLSRLGLTGLGTFIFSFIFYQFDFNYGWDYFFESYFPLLAPLTGIIGFHLLDLFKTKATFGKVLRQIGYVASAFVLIAGIYTAWELLTPFSLPLQRAAPTESLNVELVRQIGGSFDSSKAQSLGSQEKLLVVRDNLVYIGIGPRLAILDISEPSRISLVGQSEIIPDEIGEMMLVGDYLYIAPGEYGDDDGNNQQLHIVNVSSPTHPQYLGMYSPNDRYVSNVFFFNNLLFVTGKDKNSNFMSPVDELYLLDITNPSSPKEISRYLFKEGISDIAVSGNYAYIAMNAGDGHAQMGVRILDISNPQALKEVNALFPKGAGSRILVNRGSLYYYGSVAGESIGLHILDISAPQFPREVAIREGLFVDPIFVSGNRMYFGGTIFDTTNPLELNEVGTLSIDGALVSFQQNLVFTIDDVRLKLYDVTDPSMPVELGEYVSSLADDGRIFVQGTNGIIEKADIPYVMSLPDVVEPMLADYFPELDLWPVVATRGTFVTLIMKIGEYATVNMADPSNPAIVWRSDTWNGYDKPFRLIAEGNYAYMINSDDGFLVYDISNPVKPVFISRQPDLGEFADFYDYAVSGDYLYVLDGRKIYILDISDKSNVMEVGGYDFPPDGSGYWRIRIVENLAFLDNSPFNKPQPATLAILDLSNPTKPRKVTSYYWSRYATLSGFSKQAVFITDYNGLHILDFSNPRNPKEVGYYGLDVEDCYAECMVLGPNNTVYISADSAGLYVLRYIPPNE